MKLRRKLGGAALLLLLGCGSSPFTVNGSIHGNSLKPGDAISAHGVLLMGGDPIHATVAVLSNAALEFSSPKFTSAAARTPAEWRG